MIWFTSDTHFFHKKVCQYRPWLTVEDMNSALVENWNDRVSTRDTVYHIGDFALTKDRDAVEKLLARLNGHKCLIKGNHDRKAVTKANGWGWIKDYHEIKYGPDKQLLVLSHYPMRSWRKSHYGSFMCHGHSHGTLIDIGGLIMDVGVDAQAFCPVSIDEVFEYMKHRSILPVDRHVPKEVVR